MEKSRFKNWLEGIETQTQGLVNTNMKSPTLKSGEWDQTTLHQRALGKSNVDVEILRCSKHLEGIRDQLKSIFSRARERSVLLGSAKVPFEREMIKGIDGVGRAHMIILPTAMGMKDE